MTRFSEDKWNIHRPLKNFCPNLFNIVHKKNVLVKVVMNGNIPNLSFHRTIVGVKLVEWHNALHPMIAAHLDQSRENFICGHIDMDFSQFAQLSGTIIRGTLKTPNSQLVTPISIKLQRPDGHD
jgi:hypothetical protein